MIVSPIPDCHARTLFPDLAADVCLFITNVAARQGGAGGFSENPSSPHSRPISPGRVQAPLPDRLHETAVRTRIHPPLPSSLPLPPPGRNTLSPLDRGRVRVTVTSGPARRQGGLVAVTPLGPRADKFQTDESPPPNPPPIQGGEFHHENGRNENGWARQASVLRILELLAALVSRPSARRTRASLQRE